ncbi:uncharacterized protein BDZ99DRAFT_306346 [Mytilinidion resinicola]|uniref:Zn(2)-C6 fungal-type domain-containing protein n=1 Tax=Mytilinidion resinicola TaxID=574789 RepID=A0A6A6YNL3_9PEZI|nr:uncharacterized protein BDZ99DRAFT_306346 [Mytilinidion resinicola]KAF2810173.1 hypothetical protein BDZ99DRAFT_306346 [Mytilinidion resinicola]
MIVSIILGSGRAVNSCVNRLAGRRSSAFIHFPLRSLLWSPSSSIGAMDETPHHSSSRIPGKNRRTAACNYCRAKKIRCNGSIPCANCLDRGEECVVTARRRPRIHDSQGHDSGDLSRRLQHLEALLGTAAEGSKVRHTGGRVANDECSRPLTPLDLSDCTSSSSLIDSQGNHRGTHANLAVSS